MKWKDRTIDEIAEMICLPQGKTDTFFVYRSSYYVARFFRDADTGYARAMAPAALSGRPGPS